MGVVISAAYVANIVAFLTVAGDKMPFQTLDEMVAQDNIKYGTTHGTVGLLVFKVGTRA